MYWKLLLFCMMPSLGVASGWGSGAQTLARIRSVGGALGLGVLVAVPLERLGEGLVVQVHVPQVSKAFVLLMEFGVVAVQPFTNEAAPLLDADVIVSPVVR